MPHCTNSAATRIRAWLAARDLRRDARAAITGRPDHIVTAIGEAGPVDLTETDLRELLEMANG